jgi:hypothetical protein
MDFHLLIGDEPSILTNFFSVAGFEAARDGFQS